MRFRSGLIALLLLSAACGQNFAESFQTTQAIGPVVALPLVDLRADVNRNGVIDVDDPTEDQDEDKWDARHGAIFLANIDDDTARCPGSGSDAQLAACHDALDEIVNGGDDVLDLAPIKVVAWPTVPTGTSGSITITPAGFTRMFRKSGDEYALFDPAVTLSTNDLRNGLDLFIEGKDILRDASQWDGYVTITLIVRSPDHGQVTDTLRMRMSPVMTFHHLTPPETSYVTRVFGDPTSNTFINALKGILQATPENAPLVEIPDQDIWTQDFFETGYMSMPAPGGTQHAVRVAYRSAGVWENSSTPLRPAGRIVFTKFRGKDSAGVQAFTLNQDHNWETLNSYGNTETIPPFEHNGQKYPLGRLLRGLSASALPDPVMKRVFEAQAVQPPVYVDTSWLLVAHVDETISFLKAPNARGWVLLLNDPRLAKQMLEAEVARGNGNVRMFIGKAFYDENWNPSPAAITIQQTLQNADVMGRSAAAAVEIDAQLEILKRETGITEAEIIRVPFLHHTEYGASVAWQPGFVNGYVAGMKDFVAPDPFGPVIDGKDIFKADFEQKLSAIGYNVRWIDDWDMYHVGAGEVHCGTNAARQIPEAKWWESGR